MIYLFHGENQPALRDALLELKKEYREAVFWEKEISELAVYLASPTLFAGDGSPGGKEELIIIEDPESNRLSELVALVEGGSKDVAIVFSDKLPQKKLPRGGGLRIRYFRQEIPQNVFPFLDALAARDEKKAFAEAHRLIKNGGDFHSLLAMIIWQMRNLVLVKGGAAGGLHPYVFGKLKRMQRNFREDELSRIFSSLLKEDLAAKRGRADAVTLDFLIARLVRRSKRFDNVGP